jgi:hypothetical protein
VNWDSIPFILWTCLSNYDISKNDLSNEGECSATSSTLQPQNPHGSVIPVPGIFLDLVGQIFLRSLSLVRSFLVAGLGRKQPVP